MMIVERVQTVYEARKKRNPAYSLRSFARSLELDSSCLSSILRGKRPLTLKMAKKILENLSEVSADEKFKLLESASLIPNNDPEKQNLILSNDQFALVADWWNYAILALLELPDGPRTETEISKRIGVDKNLVRSSLQRMKRLDFISDTDSQWVFTGSPLKTTEDIPSKALKESHRQNIELASQALDCQSVDKRDISGITFSCLEKNLPKAKEAIRKFRNEICELMEGESVEERNQVYRLNVQLFRIDKQINR